MNVEDAGDPVEAGVAGMARAAGAEVAGAEATGAGAAHGAEASGGGAAHGAEATGGGAAHGAEATGGGAAHGAEGTGGGAIHGAEARDGEALAAAAQQLSLLGHRAAVEAPGRGRRRPLPSPDELAPTDPVAGVAVDVPLPHLDRPFEYSVPRHLHDIAVPGVRVKVRFAGQDVDGYVLERRARAEHVGKLSPLRRVVSPEPVLTTTLLALCREVAAETAGTLGDVLRLAIPPRHARAEKALPMTPVGPAVQAPAGPADAPVPDEPTATRPTARAAEAGDDPWAPYPAGPSFVRRVAAGEAPAAAWSALPRDGGDWAVALAAAAAAALAGGRGAVLVVPDHRDVARVDAALTRALGPGRHVRLTADQGPQARYTAWLKLLRGHVHCVVGARAAAFAPVADVGLVAWWDDGDDLHAEPRAPYPHVRDVLRVRARLEDAALLVGGTARTVATQRGVEAGWLREIVPATRRRLAPRVRVAGEGSDAERDGPAARAHLPSAAWRAARAALEHGPVLVQVPRRGYLPSLSCATCRTPARCPACHGPLTLPGADAAPTCGYCGTTVASYTCPECGAWRLRSSAVGARRTAEELGRAFPGVAVRTSGSGDVLSTVPCTPALVIATPGAEPVADGGYTATLLLDAWASLDRPRLDAGEEALRRWLTAASLTRGAGRDGLVVLCGAPEHTTLPVVEALVRWAPEWFAGRELDERRELDLPPVTWTTRLTGGYGALVEALDQLRHLDLPESVTSIGPVPVDPPHAGRGAPPRADDEREADRAAQVLLRAPWADAPAACHALAAMRRVRSAHRGAPAVSVRVGAPDLLV